MSRFWRLSLICSVSTLALSCAQLLGDVDFEETGASVPPDTDEASSTGLPSVEGSTLGDPSASTSSDGALGTPPSPTAEDEDKAAGCDAGAFRCTGAELEYCIDALWVVWQSCGSAALCASTPAGRCLPAACTIGEHRCDGSRLEQCNGTATGWTQLDECISAAHCDATAEACTAAPCVPGGARCNGDAVELCREDQLGWEVYETCASAALCENRPNGNTAVCLSPACSPEEHRCREDGTLQVCALDQSDFVNLARCESPESCDATTGRCKAVADVPNGNAGPGGAAFPQGPPSTSDDGEGSDPGASTSAPDGASTSPPPTDGNDDDRSEPADDGDRDRSASDPGDSDPNDRGNGDDDRSNGDDDRGNDDRSNGDDDRSNGDDDRSNGNDDRGQR